MLTFMLNNDYNRRHGQVVRTPGIVIDMVSVQNLLVPYFPALVILASSSNFSHISIKFQVGSNILVSLKAVGVIIYSMY